MKHSYGDATDVDGDDDNSTSIFNSSYIHHLNHMKERHSHGSSNNDENSTSYNSNILGDHLRRTASKDYHAGGERFSGSNHTRKTAKSSSHSRSTKGNSSRPPMASLSSTHTAARRSVEDTYLQSMNRVNRGGYFHDPNNQEEEELHEYETPKERLSQQLRLSQGSSKNGSKRSARSGKSSRSSGSSSGKHSIANKVPKKSVSTSDPSEETIAVFGAYGVTGNYFLQLALEAGYKVRALILPGMELDDLSGSDQLRLITGSFDEEEKVRRVVKNASYVVCLLNDCDKTLQQQKQQQSTNTVSSTLDDNMPPVLYDTSATSTNNNGSSLASSGSIKKGAPAGSPTDPNGNYRFMQLLVPILEELDTCRVLLYQASAVARDDKGTTPIFGKVVKKLAVKKNVRQALREQDRIVKYIANSTKQTSMNFIVTRPSSDPLIWDRPSRKKLAASKSQPGPFPITNIDLAEFTLGALREKKLFNSCPYVVQDGI